MNIRRLKRSKNKAARGSNQARRLQNDIKAALKDRKDAFRRHIRHRTAQIANWIETLRYRDGHEFIKALKRAHNINPAISEPVLGIPDAEGHPMASARFPPFFRSLFEETRPALPGPSAARWKPFLATNGIDSAASLSNTINSHEIMRVLFPFSSRTPLVDCGCYECSIYNEQAQA
ncbi:MAG: hypothetical protein ACK5XN_12210, partial [Bacteroidota bacterium]